MITLTYTDAYDRERQEEYETVNDFTRMLAGCLTIPDYYPVKSVTYKGQDTGFKGSFGDLYRYFSSFDWSSLAD